MARPADDLTPVGAGDTRPKQSAAYPDLRHPAVSLIDVDAGGHEGFDRIVLEFTDPCPGTAWSTSTRRSPRTGPATSFPSRAPRLFIQTTPASGFDLEREQVRETYIGSDRVRPTDGHVVTEVVRTGDFEAQLGWVAGTSERRPFTVATLTDPPRLVVEVMQG